MVPKITKGTSFRGAANYLLYDVGADTKERVAWTEIRNVSNRNPDVAWRVMAATAMDQDRLKREAGIPNTGRKSKQSVLHFSLSWHAEEAPGLSRAEMMKAATTMLHVMKAQEHQALIVCHNDKPQPHVHVLVNRVHPRDGKMLSSSFDQLKASKWAQKYEEERGKIYCEQRVINNEARKRKEFTRGKRDEARHVHELAKMPVNDNDRKQRLLDEHRRKAQALKTAERQLQARHAEGWKQLEEKQKRMVALIGQKTKEVIARNQSQIRDRFRPRWEMLYHEHQAELRLFELREAGPIGRMNNALKSIDFKALLSRERAQDGRAKTLAEAFKLLGDAGARLQALKRQHAMEDRKLAIEQSRLERAALQQRRAEQQRYIAENRQRFQAERSTLILTQSMEQAKIKAQWRQKGREMREEWKQIRQMDARRRSLTEEFALAANEKEVDRASDPPGKPSPKSQMPATDLLPKRGAEEAARMVDRWKAVLKERRECRLEQDKDRQEDRDR